MMLNGGKREAKPEGRLPYLEEKKKLSALFRGIPSKHYSDFYCFNCHDSFRTKLESHKKVC